MWDDMICDVYMSQGTSFTKFYLVAFLFILFSFYLIATTKSS